MIQDTLAVVMPVYNEEGAIGNVLEKWIRKLDSIQDLNYKIHVYNDGSKDRTEEILAAEARKYPDKLAVHNKKNSGHGPTILQGYRENSASADWIFQIDSDDEMTPDSFDQLWTQREHYDFLTGYRDGRTQALPRKLISFVSRMTVRLFYGKSVWDVNTPYRLMRCSAFKEIFYEIPEDTFAPNVIISGMAARKKMRCYEMPVPQQDRKTGEVSIKKWKLFRAAVKSFRQTILYSIAPEKMFLFYSLLISFLFLGIGSKNSPLYPINDWGDVNTYFTLGRGLLDGYIPYVDLADHKGPLLYFLYAVAALISRTSHSGIFVLESFFFTMFLYYGGRCFSLFIPYRRLVYMIAPVTAAMVVASPSFSHGGSIEQMALGLFSCSLFYLLQNMKKNSFLSSSDFVLHGLFFAILFWIKFTLTGFYLGVVLFLAVWYLCNGKIMSLIKGAFLFLLPFLIITASVFASYSYSNALHEMLDVYFYQNVFLYGGSKTFHAADIVRFLKDLAVSDRCYIILLIAGGYFLYRLLVRKSYDPDRRKYFYSFKKCKPGYLILLPLLFLLLSCFLSVVFGYYYIIFAVFIPFGWIALFLACRKIRYCRKLITRKNQKIIPGMILLSFCSVFPLSHNTWMLKYNRSEMPQYEFARIMNQKSNPKVLNFAFLDHGFFFASGLTPRYRHFSILNMEHVWQAQKKIVESGDPDFIITVKNIWKDDLPGYRLIKESSFRFQGDLFVYQLFEKTEE